MRDMLILLTPYLISIWTLVTSWLDGIKYKYTPLLKLINCGAWYVWIFASENYGFLPLTIMLTFIYYRNHLKWTAT